MRSRIAFVLLSFLAFASCEKSNNVSKIPHISLIAFVPDSMHVNVDTCIIEFGLVDGDGDLGNDSNSAIYLKDSRFEAQGFIKNQFPVIDPNIEDPKKGLEGTCIFTPMEPPTPRLDSIHMATGDTLTYELYIKDRAGNESNHIITHPLIIRP